MIKHTLTAIALTATLAAPAQASSDDIIKGIFAVIILDQVLNSKDHNYSNDRAHGHRTIRNHYDNRVCSREIERLRNGSTMVHELDCRGNVIRSYWR